MSHSIAIGRLLALALVVILLAGLSVAAAVSGRAHPGTGQLGTYAVHHNALTTDRLTPAIAQAYGFRRSSEVVLINIAVIREQPGTTGTPVHARVVLSVLNLAGQPKTVSPVREVVEGDAIYYLATTSIAPHETLNIRVEVTPEGEARSISFRFPQSF
jgi:Domain of unknown function (DUF4426)